MASTSVRQGLRVRLTFNDDRVARKIGAGQEGVVVTWGRSRVEVKFDHAGVARVPPEALRVVETDDSVRLVAMPSKPVSARSILARKVSSALRQAGFARSTWRKGMSRSRRNAGSWDVDGYSVYVEGRGAVVVHRLCTKTQKDPAADLGRIEREALSRYAQALRTDFSLQERSSEVLVLGEVGNVTRRR